MWVHTINVLSKNKKKCHKFSCENSKIYIRENLKFIAWACYRNVLVMKFKQTLNIDNNISCNW